MHPFSWPIIFFYDDPTWASSVSSLCGNISVLSGTPDGSKSRQSGKTNIKRTHQRDGGTRQSLQVPLGLLCWDSDTSNMIRRVRQSAVKSYRPKNTASNPDTSLCLQNVTSLLKLQSETLRSHNVKAASLRRKRVFSLQKWPSAQRSTEQNIFQVGL